MKTVLAYSPVAFSRATRRATSWSRTNSASARCRVSARTPYHSAVLSSGALSIGRGLSEMSASLGPPPTGRPDARGICRSNLPRTQVGRAGVASRLNPPSSRGTWVGSPFSRGPPKCGATAER